MSKKNNKKKGNVLVGAFKTEKVAMYLTCMHCYCQEFNIKLIEGSKTFWCVDCRTETLMPEENYNVHSFLSGSNNSEIEHE